jgi:uncharacterized membrane protein
MAKEKKLWFGMTLKNFTNWDMALLKTAIIAFTLLVVSAWPAFANWVTNTPWAWFLAAWILLAIMPMIKAWKK